jgi:hypothetical protein
MKKIVGIISMGFFVSSLLCAGQAFAQTPWQKHHPRRVEVNNRLHKQNQRIDAGIRNHQLNRAEAQQLRSEDRGARQQERINASGDHGHLTKQEQQQLNHQENAISGQIHSDRIEGE